MCYKAKTPTIDLKRRKEAEKIIRKAFKAAGVQPPLFLWAGNHYQFLQLHSMVYCAAKYQSSSRYLAGSPVAKLLGLKVSRQTGMPVFEKLKGRAGVRAGQARERHRREHPTDVLDIEKWYGTPRQYSIPDPNWKPTHEQPHQTWLTKYHRDLVPDLMSLQIIGPIVVLCFKPKEHFEVTGPPQPEMRNEAGVVVQPARPEQHRLHRTDGPARIWEDGMEEYWVKGVDVTKTFVLHPERLKASQILKESNQERRRLMVEAFGQERIVREGGFEVVQKDDYGVLYRSKEEFLTDGGRWEGNVFVPHKEVVQFVEVINGTPEADGSRKHYFLQVPPTTKTAHEAVAWTYDLTPEQYHPLQRT